MSTAGYKRRIETTVQQVYDRVLGAVGLMRSPLVDPGTIVCPQVETVLTSATVQSIRTMLDEHDRGLFLRSGMLANLVTRDPDLFGALNQRLLALQGLPMVFKPARDTAAGRRSRDDLEALWPRMVPTAAEQDMLASAVLLGFGLAQRILLDDPDLGEKVPVLDPWPSSQVQYQVWEQRWYVQSLQGRVPITPGDGQWVLYAPRSVHRPYFWGALRCTAEWYLRSAFAAGDAARHSEIHGVPVWLAKLPAGARETPDAKAFVTSVRNMGRNAVIPLPQGSDPTSSYDLRIEEAKSDAYRIFEFLLHVGAGKIRLALLGQDLTSQNNKVGTNASSQTGQDIKHEIVQADAQSWADCLHDQHVRPWARYRDRVDLAPLAYRDAKPAEDQGAKATALLTTGQAIQSLQSELKRVDREKVIDVRAMIDSLGVPLMDAPKLLEPPVPPAIVVPPAPAPTPAPTPAPPVSDPQADALRATLRRNARAVLRGMPAETRAAVADLLGLHVHGPACSHSREAVAARHGRDAAQVSGLELRAAQALAAIPPRARLAAANTTPTSAERAGQKYIDKLATAATGGLSKGVQGARAAVLAAIDTAETETDLQDRLVEILRDADPEEARAVFARARVLARMAGRWAVAEDAP